jgi:hypothetical protein
MYLRFVIRDGPVSRNPISTGLGYDKSKKNARREWKGLWLRPLGRKDHSDLLISTLSKTVPLRSIALMVSVSAVISARRRWWSEPE